MPDDTVLMPLRLFLLLAAAALTGLGGCDSQKGDDNPPGPNPDDYFPPGPNPDDYFPPAPNLDDYFPSEPLNGGTYDYFQQITDRNGSGSIEGQFTLEWINAWVQDEVRITQWRRPFTGIRIYRPYGGEAPPDTTQLSTSLPPLTTREGSDHQISVQLFPSLPPFTTRATFQRYHSLGGAELEVDYDFYTITLAPGRGIVSVVHEQRYFGSGFWASETWTRR